MRRKGIATGLIGHSAAGRACVALMVIGALWGAVSWAVRLP
jgi:ABC-type protease/lipase transport system fused ATPase/permease subunit